MLHGRRPAETASSVTLSGDVSTDFWLPATKFSRETRRDLRKTAIERWNVFLIQHNKMPQIEGVTTTDYKAAKEHLNFVIKC